MLNVISVPPSKNAVVSKHCFDIFRIAVLGVYYLVTFQLT